MINYSIVLNSEGIDKIQSTFADFHKQYGAIVEPANENQFVPANSKVIINWACGWNNPQYIGLGGTVLACDEKVCFVVIPFKDEQRMSVYRHEDLVRQLKR